MPSSLHETTLQGSMVAIIKIAKQEVAFVTMLPCDRISQEELTLLLE